MQNLPQQARELQRLLPPHLSADNRADMTALMEENAQLRELVIQLSKLVVKKVVDRK
jgi:hypothetical protein